MKPSLQQARFAAHTAVARLQPLSWVCAAVHYRGLKNASLVVEGFPRSANTWTSIALADSNPSITVSSHSHCPRTVKLAVLKGIPALALIRNPLDACASQLVREPHLSASNVLRRYIAFYSHIPREIELLTFEQAIVSLRPAIERINAKYDIALTPPPIDNPQYHKHILELVDAADRADQGALNERTVARPTETSRREKNLRSADLRSHPLAPDAERLYLSMLHGRSRE